MTVYGSQLRMTENCTANKKNYRTWTLNLKKINMPSWLLRCENEMQFFCHSFLKPESSPMYPYFNSGQPQFLNLYLSLTTDICGSAISHYPCDWFCKLCHGPLQQQQRQQSFLKHLHHLIQYMTYSNALCISHWFSCTKNHPAMCMCHWCWEKIILLQCILLTAFGSP